MWRGGVDIEAGGKKPVAEEPPEHRWGFIRKVYIILSIQIFLTAGVAYAVVKIHPIQQFLTSTPAGIVVQILIIITPFIVLIGLCAYSEKHPVNHILLTIFTLSFALLVGLACAHTKGEIVLEASILSGVVVTGLTLYTFWATKRGLEFEFLGPFLFSATLVLIGFGLIQAFWPLGRLSRMIYSGLSAILYCGYIIYDTYKLIKRCSYDEYIWAVVSLYIDVVGLFLGFLGIGNNI
ncbi:unnamed protein product [Cuscuta campestris]|uniref:BI1-like protein n=1 Tax=Cuscuta campestris TaxID=132261 RepID=A0A484NLR2_9ASTE|nr:unnamed protein product [Cuscuta campestris]